jgi:hypothetical protein
MTNATKSAGIGCAALLSAALMTPTPSLAEPPSEPVPGVDPDQSLSEQLDESKGVIDPPPIGDAGIHVPAPDPTPGTTPVIPPPGTPGGDPTVQPK